MPMSAPAENLNPPADQPKADRALPWVVGIFSLVLAVAAFTAVQAVRNMQRAKVASDWVNHSHAVVSECGALLAELFAAEATVRAFVLTGHALDRAAGNQALAKIEEHGAILLALTETPAEQRTRSSRIDRLIRQRSDFLQTILATGNDSDAGQLNRQLIEDLGLAGTREIKAELEKLKGVVLARLAERDHEYFRQTKATRLTVWTGLGLNLVLLGSLAWMIRGELAARRRKSAALRRANETLGEAVAAQTARLRAANERLEEENHEHRWANLALEHQVKYSHAIINALREPVLVITKAMNVTRANPATLDLLDRFEEEIVNQPLAALVRLATQTGDHDLLERTLHHGRDLRLQPAQALGRGGSLLPCLLTLFPLRDGDNVVGGVIILDGLRTDSDATPARQSNRSLP
jgi:CHASE3 domain sensor protein